MLTDIIKGLEIIQGVEPNNWISAEHDVIYAGGNAHWYTQDQIDELARLGLHYDDSVESFRRFV